MSPAKSPFVKKKVPCPICGQESENRFFLPKSFVEKGQESDHHAIGYKWMDEAFQDIHPPFYHFWHCGACMYTATQKDFLKPGEDADSNFNVLKKAIQRMNPAQKQIVQMLGSGVDYENMAFPMALNLHLLAVFIQEALPDDQRDTSKLGSFYLRIAWLIREQLARENGSAELEKCSELLDRLARVWTELPRTEADCLKKAAAYYEQAYQRHPRYTDIVLASELMILISNLYMRADDATKAMQSLNVVMQTGQKFRAKQQETILKEKAEGHLTVTRKAQIDAQTNRVNALMEQAGDMRQTLIKKRIEKQEPKARQVVEKLTAGGMDTEQIREKMKELNFEPQLIIRLLGEPKRKKFLGLF